MSILDDMPELLTTTIVIKKHGAVTSNPPSGPVYAADIECYNDLGAFYLLSAGEVLVMDRVGNPSTHNIIMDPAKISSAITSASWAVIKTVTYTLCLGENDILELGEVAEVKAVKSA